MFPIQIIAVLSLSLSIVPWANPLRLVILLPLFGQKTSQCKAVVVVVALVIAVAFVVNHES